MKHFTFDIYNSNVDVLSSIRLNYDFIRHVQEKFKLKSLYKPHCFPYYDGKVFEDDGLSFCVFLEPMGHITLHNFERMGCSFVDIFTNKNINEDELKTAFVEFFQTTDIDYNLQNTNKSQSFGPHFIGSGVCELTADKVFDFLLKTPEKISMHPITPVMLKENEKYICGIVLIAESHISLYYNKATKEYFLDVFSCVMGKENKTEKYLKDVFPNINLKLNIRGSKYRKNK